jgi:hypothetical protein
LIQEAIENVSPARPEPTLTRGEWWLALAGSACFMSFLIGCFVLGGTAVGGEVVNGHYFLRDHTRMTEVSRAVFIFSAWHYRVGMLGFCLAGLIGWRAHRRSRHTRR